jgi:serine/threonine protein kinase
VTHKSPALSPMHRLGAYQLLERLGRGGMGEVWRAEHVRLGRQAAIKLIRPRDAGESGEQGSVVRRRFEREARATASLTSPHTVSLYDFGVASDGTFYYAMELLEGLDLDALVTRHGPQPPARVVHLVAQACDSLAEAHARGLLHRDIKPSNLFVCRRGLEHDFVKVLDFGLVKAVAGGPDGGPVLTGEHRRVGTPAFMAPEAARGALSLDARADLYALGCVAYFLLTASNVFSGESALALMLQHADTSPEPPSLRTHFEVPADVEAVVMSCLAKAPAERPASARALKEALLSCGVGRLWTPDRAEQWWRSREPEALPFEAPLLPFRDVTQPTLDEWARTRPEPLAWASESTLVDAEPVVATNVPAELTSFVGRSAELAQLRRALLRGARVVTLHGPGGVGKSRVALRFAGQAASDYGGGAWYADLSAARSDADVCQGVAEALSILLTTGEPAERLGRVLAARSDVLLVLDNVEHVAAAVGQLVAQWLTEAARLRVVVTSREPLRVPGELVVPVEPFALPPETGSQDPASLVEMDSVALFVARAAAVEPGFALTGENGVDVARLVHQL